MKVQITEFVEIANQKIKEEILTKSSDSRLAESLTERRIRDYATKDVMDKPIKEGRNAYYTEKHLEQVLDIRKLQVSGISDKFMATQYSSSLKQASPEEASSIISNCNFKLALNNNSMAMSGATSFDSLSSNKPKPSIDDLINDIKAKKNDNFNKDIYKQMEEEFTKQNDISHQVLSSSLEKSKIAFKNKLDELKKDSLSEEIDITGNGNVILKIKNYSNDDKNIIINKINKIIKDIK
jgi:hypothetical protein